MTADPETGVDAYEYHWGETMRPPRLRFTVRRMMVVTATLAASWSMCLGIGHLTIYRANVQGERADMEEALMWETRQESAKAADCRRKAAEWARRNVESFLYIITALSLTALGIVTRGLSLAFKARSKTENLVHRPLMDACVGVCLTLSKICLVGLALGCYGYLVAMLFVVVTAE
jgi:hypothetical protein